MSIILMLKKYLIALNLISEDITSNNSTKRDSDSDVKPKNWSKIGFFKTNFFISKGQIAFICLQNAYTKAFILYYFYHKYYNHIVSDSLG